MQQSVNGSDTFLWSYMAQRRALGWFGLLLPAVLALGGLLLFAVGLQASISHYYYTGMVGVFVGVLFAIGVFLVSYKGFDKRDDRAADVAGVSAIGIALLPTTPEGAATTAQQVVGGFHFAFAALFLLTLAYISLKLFTLSDQEPLPPQKRRRNLVYRVCGVIMLAALALIALVKLLPVSLTEPLLAYQPVFWLEAIAVMAFGVSWLTKGEAILGD